MPFGPGPAPAPFPMPFGPGPAPAPFPLPFVPTKPYLFELPPPSFNSLYAATWSSASVAFGDALSLTLTTNMGLYVFPVTMAGYDQFNSCASEALPAGFAAVASASSNYFFGMKANENIGPCLSAVFASSTNIFAAPFEILTLGSSKVSWFVCLACSLFVFSCIFSASRVFLENLT